MQDLLLHIDTYPEPTPFAAIDQAIDFAALNGGRLSALAVKNMIRLPDNPIANRLIGLSGMAAEEQAKSARAANEAGAYFADRAKAKGVFEQTLFAEAEPAQLGDCIAAHARTRDATLIPIAEAGDGQRFIAENVMFGAGRPAIVFSPGGADLPREALGTIVLAWDNTRLAARALAAALPLMRRAQEVRVLTILNEKPAAAKGVGKDVVRHLTLHGVKAGIDEIDGAGKPIGVTLDAYISAARCDLLAMGAYGKSRVREFILGGATAHVLSQLKAPLFLVH